MVPLLFTEAYHATIDVPETVRDVAESLPLQLVVADILGTGDDVARLLVQAMDEAGIDDQAQCCCSLSGRRSLRPTRLFLILPLGSAGAVSHPVRACFGTCAPGVADVLDGLAEPIAILPLFLAEGLLLSHVRALAAQHGWRIAAPLGERAAELVRQRYQRACAQLAS